MKSSEISGVVGDKVMIFESVNPGKWIAGGIRVS
jgi:hypothetical protein